MSLEQRLDSERKLFASLSIEQIETLAKASQDLVDRAKAMALANRTHGTPAGPVTAIEPFHGDAGDCDPNPKVAERQDDSSKGGCGPCCLSTGADGDPAI